MSLRFIIMAVLCLLILPGCAKQHYELGFYHPHKDFSLWQEDLDDCHHSVMALKQSDRLQQGSFGDGVEACMEAKGYVYGYSPYPAPPSAEGVYRAPEGMVFTLLDSTWHTTKLAEQRARYLEDTGVWSTIVRSWDSGTAGIWQQVLIGSYESVSEAREARRRLVKSHGLKDLSIVLR